MIPGEVIAAEGRIELNRGRARVILNVRNRGDRPIQIGSHAHFFEVNRALAFDRAAAYGFRLDVPAGTSVRFEPGEERPVELVALAGRRVTSGGNRLAEGPLDDDINRGRALDRVSRYAG